MQTLQTQAIVFTAQDYAALETIDLPPLLPTDALVDVEMSGVSVGTEVWALTGQRPPGDTTFPCVPGYQAVGIVREAGPEAAVRPGERLFFTKSRLTETHERGNWMGAHVRQAVVDASAEPTRGYWVRVPGNLKPEDVALSALGAVADRGLLHVGVEPDDLCVVLGQGVIGQCAAQIARLYGAQIFTADVAANRLALSLQYSADHVWNPQDGDLAAEVRRLKAAGADLVVEASGNKTLIPQAISLVRPLGRVLLQGWYPGDVAFDFHKAHGRRPTIAVTCGMDRESNQRVIDWLSNGKMNLAPLLTHTLAPEQAGAAYAMMRTRPGDFLGVAFDWR